MTLTETRRRVLWREAAAIAAVALVGFVAAQRSYSYDGTLDPFTHAAFGPAVMIAAGHGFVNPEVPPGSDLEAFLAGRMADLDGSTIGDRSGAPTPLQEQHRYLLTVAGAWWRVTGISWHRLSAIAGVMHALAVTGAYALLRLLAARWAALAGAVWFALAPTVLARASELRDFSKAGFLLASLALLLYAVLRASSPRAAVAASAGAGLLIGLGIGFRIDVIVMAPIGLVLLPLFRGERPWQDWRTKAPAMAAFAAAILVTGGPLLARAARGGSNTFHVVLLGYSDWFDDRLGVRDTAYSVLRYYNDTHLEYIVRDWAEQHGRGVVGMPSSEYDAATRAVWGEVAGLFPADVWTRYLGAVNGVFNLPFDAGWGGVFAGWGGVLAVVLVVAAATRRARIALLSAFLTLALAGYPSLQFDPRHSFHLSILPIAATVILASWMAAGVPWRGLARPLVIGITIAVASTIVPVAVLRAYQEPRLRQAIADTLAAASEPLPVTWSQLSPDRWLLSWPGILGRSIPGGDLTAAYYVAEFDADHDSSLLAIRLRYDVEPDWKPCPTTLSLVSRKGIARFVFPAYSLRRTSEFQGIEIPDHLRNRFRAVYRAGIGPGGLPVELRLPAEWQHHERWFQRVRIEPPSDAVVHVRSSRATGCASDFAHLSAAGVPSLRADMLLEGPADRFTPWPAARSVTMTAGDTLVAFVTVERGGVAIGLADDRGVRTDVVVQSPGRVVIAVPAAGGGAYVPYVEDARPRGSRATRVRVHHIGVAASDGSVRRIDAVTP